MLGNALLHQFVSASFNRKDLTDAQRAYNRAQICGEGRANPDLHFHRGLTLSYLQEYADAVSAYLASAQLDPSLRADEKAQSVKHIHERLFDLVRRKGGLKPKRVSALLDPLRALQMTEFEGREVVPISKLA